jgi:hypothetical protein
MQTGLDNGIGDWRSHIFFFWLGIVGTVGSLIGIVLSFYFYQESQIKPLLTFSVHPLKTELQRPDFDKELGFIYKGKPVNSESITSVQVCIWNAGTRSIRDSDVLEPFRLVMPDGAAILSVRVKKPLAPSAASSLSIIRRITSLAHVTSSGEFWNPATVLFSR